jgi:two-component system, chemotaxis family, CheB/CheR fusion protein
LQSGNEELETSKEELQSMNEELQTINGQPSIKVQELDRTASDLRNLFESPQVATVFLDRFLIIRSFTPAMASIYNLIPMDGGRPLTDIVCQVDYSDLRTDVRRVLDTLEPFERRVSRQDGSLHYLMRILPYRESDNQVQGVIITFVDVTGIVQAEQHHRLLVDEMDHRVRNMLTVVIPIAGQTLRRSKTLEQFSDAYLGRIHAMAAAYTLLSRQGWKSVRLREILDEELKPFMVNGAGNVSISGPTLQMSPGGALAFGMIIHELATNAVKYGAFSTSDGHVVIDWRIEAIAGSSRFIFSWKEQGGLAVTPPPHHGFGTAVIDRTLKHELRGQAELDFSPNGLQATLYVPFELAVVQTGAIVGAATS